MTGRLIKKTHTMKIHFYQQSSSISTSPVPTPNTITPRTPFQLSMRNNIPKTINIVNVIVIRCLYVKLSVL